MSSVTRTSPPLEPYQDVDFFIPPEERVDFTYNPHMTLLTLYSSVILLSLGANSLLFIVILKFKYIKVASNLFLLNLVAADLLVTVVCMPVQLSKAITLVWFYGSVFCKMVNYLQGVSVAASVLTIAAMAVDRYLAISPGQPLRPCGRRVAAVVLPLLWSIALLTFCPLLVVSTTVTDIIPVYTILGNQSFPRYRIVDKKMNFCIEEWSKPSDRRNFGVFSFLIICLLPGILTTLSYVFMGRTLCDTQPPYDSDYENSGAQQAMRLVRERRRLAYVLLTVASLFTLCWLPYNVLLLLLDADIVSVYSAGSVVPYLLLLGHTNSAMNPVIYFLMTRSFRNSLRKLIFCSENCVAPYHTCADRRRGRCHSSDSNAYHGPHKKCFRTARVRACGWHQELELQQRRIDLRVQTSQGATVRGSRRLMHAHAAGALRRHGLTTLAYTPGALDRMVGYEQRY